MTTGVSSGVNISEAFAKLMVQVQEKGQDLNDEISKLSGTGEISDEDMLNLQFQMNQYNTLLESVSSLTKSMTDEAKQLAQRSN